MKNENMPAFAQSEEWQKDMEKHKANPEKYGSPSLDGIGLTKREYFAALAMQGLLSNSDMPKVIGIPFHWEDYKDNVVNSVIDIVDAIMEELEK